MFNSFRSKTIYACTFIRVDRTINCYKIFTGRLLDSKIPQRKFSVLSRKCVVFNEIRTDEKQLKMDFETDFQNSHVKTTQLQKILLTFGSSVMSLYNPMRADMIAVMAETAGASATKYMFDKMNSDPDGQLILRDKPRLNSKTVNLNELNCLPKNTLGKTYINFLNKNNVTPDTRLQVQFVDDVELAYVIQRYREIHDIVHAILDMPTNMLGEVTVKWIEAIQTRLPMCIGGALFGAMRLSPKQRKRYVETYLPWAIQTGTNSSFLMNVYFEKRWNQSIDELLYELNIQPLKK